MRKISDFTFVLIMVLSISFCTLLIQNKNKIKLAEQKAFLETINNMK